MTAPVKLSVVVALQQGEHWSPGGLASLVRQRQDVGAEVEILLVDGRREAAAPLPGLDPGVRRVPAPQAGALPLLIGLGIAASRGEWVATTEAHVAFASDWLRAALAQPRGEAVAVRGGAVLPGLGVRLLGRAVFFCDYYRFLPPLEPGPARELAGCNVLFRRDVLPAAEELARDGFWKTFYCAELERRGVRLEADPALVVYYNRSPGARAWLRRRWAHGRCFGAMRAAAIPWWRRVLILLAAPVLPFLLTMRLLRGVWQKRPWRRPLLGALPLCFLTLLLWVVGESVGNVLGAGRSCAEV